MRHTRMLPVALCAVLMLGGCGGGDDDGGDNPDGADTPAATAESGGTNEAEGTATPTAGTVEEEPLAQQAVRARTTPSATVDVAVLSLKVDGELATLELSFTPHDPEPEDPDAQYSVEELHGRAPTALLITLVDPVNLKRYMVVNDSRDNALETNTATARVDLDQTITTKHTFAAPPPDVTKIDVSVGDWPTFRNVPIER